MHFLSFLLAGISTIPWLQPPLILLHLTGHCLFALSPVSRWVVVPNPNNYLMECVRQWSSSKLLYIWMHWERATPAKLCLPQVEARAVLSTWHLCFRIMSFLEVEKLVTVWEQAGNLCPEAHSCSSWTGAASHEAEPNGIILASSHSRSPLPLCSSPKMGSGAPESGSLVCSAVQIRKHCFTWFSKIFLAQPPPQLPTLGSDRNSFLSFPHYDASFMILLKNLSSGCSVWVCISHPDCLGKNGIALTFDLRWLVSFLRSWSMEQQRQVQVQLGTEQGQRNYFSKWLGNTHCSCYLERQLAEKQCHPRVLLPERHLLNSGG